MSAYARLLAKHARRLAAGTSRVGRASTSGREQDRDLLRVGKTLQAHDRIAQLANTRGRQCSRREPFVLADHVTLACEFVFAAAGGFDDALEAHAIAQVRFDTHGVTVFRTSGGDL